MVIIHFVVSLIVTIITYNAISTLAATLILLACLLQMPLEASSLSCCHYYSYCYQHPFSNTHLSGLLTADISGGFLALMLLLLGLVLLLAPVQQ
jgi:hypothetical protein